MAKHDPISDLRSVIRIARAASAASGVSANLPRIDAALRALDKIETLIDAARGVVHATGNVDELRSALAAFA